jgi:hypothetical protein
VLPRYIHVYFHDTDLLSRRRASALTALLGILSRRARVTDLDSFGETAGELPELSWVDVARL